MRLFSSTSPTASTATPGRHRPRRRTNRTVAALAALSLVLSVVVVVLGVPGIAPTPAADAAAGTTIAVDGPVLPDDGIPTMPSSPCLLADATEAANTNKKVGGCPAGGNGVDRIVLRESIGLDGELPVLTGRTIVDGGGRTVSGQGTERGFRVAGSGAAVTFTDLRITNASLVGADLASCRVASECGASAVGGSALHVSNGATVTVDRVRIDDNEVTGGSGSGLDWSSLRGPNAQGGRGGNALGTVYVEDATLDLSRSIIKDNSASAGRGGRGQDGSRGITGPAGKCNGIFDEVDGPYRGYPGGNDGFGGQGGTAVAGFYANESTVTISASTFIGNEAIGGDGGAGGSAGAGGPGASAITCTKRVSVLPVSVTFPAGAKGPAGRKGSAGAGGSAYSALVVDPGL